MRETPSVGWATTNREDSDRWAVAILSFVFSPPYYSVVNFPIQTLNQKIKSNNFAPVLKSLISQSLPAQQGPPLEGSLNPSPQLTNLINPVPRCLLSR